MKKDRKIYLYLILVTFCTFILSPSLIILTDNSADVSYFYNLAEEEEKHETGVEKSAKHILYFEDFLKDTFEIKETSQNIIASNEMSRYSFHPELLLPPPEHISLS
ncbi:hypothetical protein [Robertkochia solimangrovi]|uniref:hypothetical protein n=1 Tax=Robertkochia solimangrovi TaxID=2213046 RepID=UPI00117F1A67|nr:hypothetical protein [Robertkochia solimangrovi]TRZ45874.1 hypothetical protein DMZ48_00935 [Robertkochia solimangrovi]